METGQVGGNGGTSLSPEVQERGPPSLRVRESFGGSQDEGILCRELFPLEIWKMILKFVHDVDKDSLWKCRYVCRDIKKLADEVQKERATLWKEKLVKGKENLGRFLSDVKGTWISSEAETIKFIEDMENSEGSPFPNGTLILGQQCPKGNDLSSDTPAVPYSMLESLGRLSAVYGEDIICLVYCLQDVCSFSTEILEIGTVLQLKKLRSLVIYKRQWNQLEEILVLSLYDCLSLGATAVNNVSVVKELQIFGLRASVPFTMILPLFKDALARVTHLRTSGAETNLLYEIFGAFKWLMADLLRETLRQHHPLNLGHLEKVNLLNPNKHIIDFLLSCTKNQATRHLKEIHLKYLLRLNNNEIGDEDVGDMPMESLGQRMSEVICSLSRGAGSSLQRMTINVERNYHFWINRHRNPELLELKPPITADHQFVELTHLTINLVTILCWSPFVTKLTTRKMPNLKEVTVLIVEELDVEGKSEEEFVAFLNAHMWQIFPASVEVIRLPWFGDRQLTRAQSASSGSSS